MIDLEREVNSDDTIAVLLFNKLNRRIECSLADRMFLTLIDNDITILAVRQNYQMSELEPLARIADLAIAAYKEANNNAD